MRTKLAVVIAIAVFVVAWFFRFEPLPTGAPAALLDRWTGAVHLIGVDGVRRIVP